MRKSIAVHMLLLGFCVSSAIAEPVEVKLPQQKTLSSSGGRFAFGQISDFRRDQYMIDTLTGRLWQKVCAKSNDSAASPDDCIAVLQPVPYVGADDKWSVTPK